jgi:hypothetical protein
VIPHSESAAPILGSSQEPYEEIFETQQSVSKKTSPPSKSSVLGPLRDKQERDKNINIIPSGCINAVDSLEQFNDFKSAVLNADYKYVIKHRFSSLLSLFFCHYFDIE